MVLRSGRLLVVFVDLSLEVYGFYLVSLVGL